MCLDPANPFSFHYPIAAHDFHPITGCEVLRLLELAKEIRNIYELCSIQTRLCQGVLGAHVPYSARGWDECPPTELIQSQLSADFVEYLSASAPRRALLERWILAAFGLRR